MSIYKQRNQHRDAKRQRGAVAIIVAICLTVLVGMIGLVVDLGHMFVIKTELQNAADSCALAAASELDGTPDSLQRAENAGITVGMRNNVDLQDEAVEILPSDVTFSENLSPNGNYVSRAGGASASSNYVMCTLSRPGIAMWFMQVSGFGDQEVGARAVAGIQPAQTTCAIPIGVCQQKTPTSVCDGGGVPDLNGLCVGEWIGARNSPGTGLTGSFNWVDFTPPGGGASELAALLEGSGHCDLATGDPVGQTGVAQSLEAPWNTRFGLYKPGNPNKPKAAPDFTGYAYTTTPEGKFSFPQQRDALGDFELQRQGHKTYQGDGLTGLRDVDTQYNSTNLLSTIGASRRLATAPVIDCDGYETSQTVPVLAWACVLMLHPMGAVDDPMVMEYRGASNVSNSPCVTYGVAGGTNGPPVPTLVQ